MTSRSNIQPNNFDLIRLFAACQVMVIHVAKFMHLGSSPILEAIGLFPGVPIFFFISGFLISRSWERSPRLASYAGNRIRRIYPALWLVFAITAAIVLVVYRIQDRPIPIAQFATWAIAQLTIGQDWNPKFLLPFGTGAVNGSLWTIPIELSFYVLVPILYVLHRRLGNAIFWVVWLLSFSILYRSPFVVAHSHGIFNEFRLYVSPLPWTGMFLTGLLAQRAIRYIKPIVENRFWIFFLLYSVMAIIGKIVEIPVLFGAAGNQMPFLNFLALVAIVLASAYTVPTLADRLLHRNDVSYGTYIFHMPIVNTMVHFGLGGLWAFGAAIVATLGAATASWFGLEKRVLFTKPVTIHAQSDGH